MTGRPVGEARHAEFSPILVAAAVGSVTTFIGAATFGTRAVPLWFVGAAGVVLIYARLISAPALGILVAGGSAIAATLTFDRTPEAELMLLAYPLSVFFGLLASTLAVVARRFIGMRRPRPAFHIWCTVLASVGSLIAISFP